MLTVLCKSTLLRMRLTMGVRRGLCCERLAMGYMGGFLFCLRVRRGVCVIDWLFCNQYFISMDYLHE